MSATTTIRMRDLALMANIGVYDWEHEHPQPIILHLDIELTSDSGRCAAESDDLANTLDYSMLEHRLAELLLAKHYQLLEHLASIVAAHVLAHPLVQRVCVEIVKPGALKYAPAVSLRHEAAKNSGR